MVGEQPEPEGDRFAAFHDESERPQHQRRVAPTEQAVEHWHGVIPPAQKRQRQEEEEKHLEQRDERCQGPENHEIMRYSDNHDREVRQRLPEVVEDRLELGNDEIEDQSAHCLAVPA